METFKLKNGVEIPVVGLGTWQSEGEDAYNAVLTALKNGYRHIDAAMIYGNEEEVGRAIKDSGIKREDLFITSKLWNTDQGYETTKFALNNSLDRLGLEYLDLYLIHWPKGYEKARGTWWALEELHSEGKVRALGVSNFNIHHIDNILKYAKKVKPVVNQVECHVELQNHVLQEYCANKGIILEAYAPLMSSKVQDLLAKEELKTIANKYNKTIPQVAIRWLVQRGIVALPKSITPERIIENFDVFDFELTNEDMSVIRKLNTAHRIFPEPDNIDF